MSDTRFKQGDVTETLVRATERATEMNATDVLVVLYARHPTDEEYKLSVVCSDDITGETANWILDKVKHKLVSEEEE